jgi:hypothetical protein
MNLNERQIENVERMAVKVAKFMHPQISTQLIAAYDGHGGVDVFEAGRSSSQPPLVTLRVITIDGRICVTAAEPSAL